MTDVRHEPVPPTCGALARLLDDACRDFGAAVALDGAGGETTYADLRAGARAVAAALFAAGIVADEPVHVAVSNQSHDIAAIFGVWLAGAVAVPVHRTTPAPVAARLRARTGARFVVGAERAAHLAFASADPPPQRPLLAGAAFVIFTSGSTGDPKGVVVRHDAFAGKLGQIDSLLRFTREDRTLLVLNMTFSFGLWLSLLTLLRGGTLVMREKFDATSFCRDLVGERITRVGMVPTMMRVLFCDPSLAAGIDDVVADGALRQIAIGGESLGRSLADAIRSRFASTELVDIYGLTETATCDFFAFPSDYVRLPGCIGRSAPGVRFRIVDADDRVVAAGAIGELQIASPYLTAGYLDAPELTTAAFDGPWFRTGDLARSADGALVELMGRRKEVISRGGNKVTPVEIEQAVSAHPDVAAAMATGVDDPLLGERIHVLLVARGGSILDVASVQRFLDGRLERFKQPDAYYLADELPTGRTGKADRNRLRTMIHEGAVQALAHSPDEESP